MNGIPVFKVVVLGYGEALDSEHVGKTSISLKFVRNDFSEKKIQTINASYLEKIVRLANGRSVKLAIWVRGPTQDTAGQEEFSSVARIYYRDAAAAIVVYDITKSETFGKVRKWIEELEEHTDRSHIVMAIAGNKSDLEAQRAIPHAEAEAFARTNNAKHFLVSAKNGNGIEQLFADLA